LSGTSKRRIDFLAKGASKPILSSGDKIFISADEKTRFTINSNVYGIVGQRDIRRTKNNPDLE
jgi:hypothetical protein